MEAAKRKWRQGIFLLAFPASALAAFGPYGVVTDGSRSEYDMWGKPAVVHGACRTRQALVTGEPLYFTGGRLLSAVP